MADYYEDAKAPEAAAPGAKAAPEGKEGASDSATAVIPKALLAGKEWKPGEEIMLEIVQLTEDGAVVKYASEKGEEGEHDEYAEKEASAGGGGNPGGNPGGGMASMMY